MFISLYAVINYSAAATTVMYKTTVISSSFIADALNAASVTEK